MYRIEDLKGKEKRIILVWLTMESTGVLVSAYFCENVW